MRRIVQLVIKIVWNSWTKWFLSIFLLIYVSVDRYEFARTNFERGTEPSESGEEPRNDGNSGHTTIDFAGQWVMGKMLNDGYGKELYYRFRQWEVVEKCYTRDSKPANSKTTDSENILSTFMGKDDPKWGNRIFTSLAPLATADPWQNLTLAGSSLELIDPEGWADLTHPSRIPGKDGNLVGLGGAIYPPIQAFYMAPLSFGSFGENPQRAYFFYQEFLLGLTFLAGYGVRYLTRGRIWMTIATTMIILYPGYRGNLALAQNSVFTLTLLIWGWAFARRGYFSLAGIIWGLMAFKPVWAISFFIALIFLRQFRMLLAMGATGVCLILLSLPFVGIGAWLDWLAVGREASALYNVNHAWVHLSRDLFGLTRRLMINFDLPDSAREKPHIFLVSWLVWVAVIEFTVRFYLLRFPQKSIPLVGSLPAMIFFMAWLTTYHFMYYDALMSIFPWFVWYNDRKSLWKEPVQLQPKDAPSSRNPISKVYFNSLPVLILLLIYAQENYLDSKQIFVTIEKKSILYLTENSAGETSWKPAHLEIGTGGEYPWVTYFVLLAWFGSGIRVVLGESPQKKDP